MTRAGRLREWSQLRSALTVLFCLALSATWTLKPLPAILDQNVLQVQFLGEN